MNILPEKSFNKVHDNCQLCIYVKLPIEQYPCNACLGTEPELRSEYQQEPSPAILNNFTFPIMTEMKTKISQNYSSANPVGKIKVPIQIAKYYDQHPSGVECITITEHMSFNLGNAMKYIWRAGLKGPAEEDLLKAIWYLKREVEKTKTVVINELAN